MKATLYVNEEPYSATIEEAFDMVARGEARSVRVEVVFDPPLPRVASTPRERIYKAILDELCRQSNEDRPNAPEIETSAIETLIDGWVDLGKVVDAVMKAAEDQR